MHITATSAQEKMSEFFNARADMYDSHMIDDLGLDEFYEAIAGCFDSSVKRKFNGYKASQPPMVQ